LEEGYAMVKNYDALIKPYARKIENYINKQLGREIPCAVRHTINALWEGAEIRPKLYQEKKPWGWEFKIYVAPGYSHKDVTNKADHFESITGCECTFFSRNKALIMRVIEKPLEKNYPFDLAAIGLNDKDLILPLGFDLYGTDFLFCAPPAEC
jgi:hypothetical protein